MRNFIDYHHISFDCMNVMTTRYITLSAGTSNVMTTSVTIMQIFTEKKLGGGLVAF